MDSPLALKAIHHQSVIVTHEERARDFYGRILGLQEVPSPSTFQFPVIWYALSDQQIHLIVDDQADSVSQRHVALQVDDAVRARNGLRAMGVELEEVVEILGADRFFVSDPDGNRIELIQWKIPWGQGPM